jgi:hypothetical protein
MRVGDPARKHAVADEDMLHAMRHAIRELAKDEVTMLIGPARDGSLLEIGVLDIESEDAVIVHAMPLRRGFYRYL